MVPDYNSYDKFFNEANVKEDFTLFGIEFEGINTSSPGRLELEGEYRILEVSSKDKIQSLITPEHRRLITGTFTASPIKEVHLTQFKLALLNILEEEFGITEDNFN